MASAIRAKQQPLIAQGFLGPWPSVTASEEAAMEVRRGMAPAHPLEAGLPRARQARSRPARMPTAKAQSPRGHEHRQPRPACAAPLEGRRAQADRPARVPSHRRHLARRCRCEPEGRVRPDGTCHARPAAGAATITLARYTHTLPDAMERAREQLDAFLAQAAADASTSVAAEIHS